VESKHRWWHPPAILTLTILAIGYKELLVLLASAWQLRTIGTVRMHD